MPLDTTVRTIDEAVDRRAPTGPVVDEPTGTRDGAAQHGLTAAVTDGDGELVGGIEGWTRGAAAGITLVWVRADQPGAAAATALVEEFEAEARRRGCDHVLVTSSTLPARGDRARRGYREVFRWDDLPAASDADVHLRKDL